MAGRHRRRRKTIAVFALAILVLIAVGIVFGAGRIQMASLSDYVWTSGPTVGGSASI
jgi:hypothetical protein